LSLLHFAPALLGKLTNFFLTASNRIVKDPRAPAPPYRIRKPTAGLETCASIPARSPLKEMTPEVFAYYGQNFGLAFG
jgi:hypothetical protein